MAAPNVKVTIAEDSGIQLPSTGDQYPAIIITAERGPINEPVFVASEKQLVEIFGGYTPNSPGMLAIRKGYFANVENHGLYVVRVVHLENPDNPETATAKKATAIMSATGLKTPATVIGTNAAPYDVEDLDVIRASVNGAVPQAATLRVFPASVTSTTIGPISGTMSLTVSVDGTDYIYSVSEGDVADANAPTVAEFVARWRSETKHCDVEAVDIDGTDYLRFSSATKGNASRLQIASGDLATMLGLSTDEAQGSGPAASTSGVTAEEVLAWVQPYEESMGIRMDFTPEGLPRLSTIETGASASIQVGPTTASYFGFDSDFHAGSDSGTAPVLEIESLWAHDADYEIETGISPIDPAYFFLALFDDGEPLGVWSKLSLNPADNHFVEDVINSGRLSSKLIRVSNLSSDGSIAPSPQTVQLSGGSDGLVGLNDADFIGSSVGGTGLHALDTVLDLSVICIPGISSAIVVNALVDYLTATKQGTVNGVIDPPMFLDTQGMLDWVQNTAALLGRSSDVATQWPHGKCANPSERVYGKSPSITYPISAAIVGIMERTAQERGGIFRSPAGVNRGEIRGLLSLESNDTYNVVNRNRLFDSRVNPIHREPGTPFYLGGQRTLKEGTFDRISTRRGVQEIKRSILSIARRYLEEDNDIYTRDRIYNEIFAYLYTLIDLRAFRYSDPDKAFQIHVSSDPIDVFDYLLNIKVSVAMNKTIENIEITIAEDIRDILAVIQG